MTASPTTAAPRATYRLQLHAGFTFADAAAAVPYLAALGVSHLYLSPVLQAADGSTHGYDVVDPDRVSEPLGGEAGFAALVAAVHAAGLGILLDIVPNHMSIAGTANRWWLDVLENGPASYYAPCFDVDWSGPDNRVMLPMLGERYGRALASGVLGLERTDALGAGFVVRVHDARLPLAPRSLGPIVVRAAARVTGGHPELAFLGDALAELPRSGEADPVQRRRRHRDKAVLVRLLLEIAAREPVVDQALTDEVAAINRDPVALDAVLEVQNYRLAHWTTAADQLSYRRFFDIATLVGIRAEDPDVVEASHHRIFGWLADGSIAGVRVDHVDGLRDPGAYLARLHEIAPHAWIVVEKILGPDEALPASWACDGTTGYEFMERIGVAMVDPAGEAGLTAAFEAYTGEVWAPAAESRRARLEVMSDALHSELARLTELAIRACGTSHACRDYTGAEIQQALAEILAGYANYRTYLGAPDADRADGRAVIAAAVAAAAAARPELDPDLLAFLEAALAFELPQPEAAELARAMQQASGPVVAKGDEDTLLYRQVRLLSRCEVGSHLAHFGCRAAQVHAWLASGPPRALLATSTHDSKRSEDVRMRIAALAEDPEAWRAAAERWGERARAGWGEVAADRSFEYAAWQTLVGAWPLPEDRAQRWAEKATREARQRTSWRRPEPAYEAARAAWLSAVYADAELVAEIAAFAERVRPLGDRNALAQLLIKLTAPGVPDLYQGSELRDDSLVDPDNRRPVALDVRHARLCEIAAPGREVDLDAAKLWLIHQALALRAREAAAFAGGYQALAVDGADAERAIAYARLADGVARVVAVAPRFGAGARALAQTTVALPAGTWRDVLTEASYSGDVALATLWSAFPGALLISQA